MCYTPPACSILMLSCDTLRRLSYPPDLRKHRIYAKGKHNVTMRGVRATIVVVEKYYIFWVCVSRLRYPVNNAHAPYFHQWPARLYIFSPVACTSLHIFTCGLHVSTYFHLWPVGLYIFSPAACTSLHIFTCGLHVSTYFHLWPALLYIFSPVACTSLHIFTCGLHVSTYFFHVIS